MKHILLALLLAACGSPGGDPFTPSKPPAIHHSDFQFSIRVNPEQLPADNVNGTATQVDMGGKRICVVNLREYPRCLLHEIRHCIEGDWHDPGVPNSEDC